MPSFEHILQNVHRFLTVSVGLDELDIENVLRINYARNDTSFFCGSRKQKENT